MELVVTECGEPTPAERPVEIVERKGLGHPDTLCDALAEEVSIALSRYYLEQFGQILHHNVDKVLLVAGQSRPVFGGGELTAPIEIYLAGRATTEVRGVRVPVEELARETCRAWLRRSLRNLDPERHVRIHCRIHPGSAELVDLFSQSGGANDSSCGAGFAPRTPLETTVLDTEAELRAAEVLDRHPERGEDLKLMGVRHEQHVALTVADAFVSRYVADLEDYRAKREALRAHARELSRAAEVFVNHADDLARGAIYLTVTGTSAEAGDDGQAGRGNRPSGLITPYRPMTMESVAGKNPVSHVGKLYNVLAGQIAQQLVSHVPGVDAAECYLVSQIGEPVHSPQLVHVRCWLAKGQTLAALQPSLRTIVDARLSRIAQLYEDFLERRLRIA